MIRIDITKEQIITDPFNGSGTTCAVAQKLGFNWLGLDVSKEAVRVANQRMKPLLNGLFSVG